MHLLLSLLFSFLFSQFGLLLLLFLVCFVSFLFLKVRAFFSQKQQKAEKEKEKERILHLNALRLKNAKPKEPHVEPMKDSCHSVVLSLFEVPELVERDKQLGPLTFDTVYNDQIAIDWLPNHYFMYPNAVHKTVKEFREEEERMREKIRLSSSLSLNYIPVPCYRVEDEFGGVNQRKLVEELKVQVEELNDEDE